METPTLYAYYRSSCSWRVRTTLNWKRIDYETIPISLIKDEQKTPEYSSLNPLQVVPTLKIDGVSLTQSIAILEYLEETRPEKPLLPRDPIKRALVRSLVQAIASDTQPVTNLRVVKYAGEERRDEWLNYWMTYAFQRIEVQLATTAGDYCVGNEVTLADVCLVPQVYNANRVNVDMSKFPTIQRINNKCLELDAFKKAHPHRQIDCPDELKEN
ncbi:maleylacetoacetate isomerase-like protein [Glomus cerebriforme]|uniref:Maleylacetoacetate isomerase-like protein n=1 Tax=Glomus cerebriforme TaxID=658196 RepID=A0A397T4M5_9GLOM|nr:maleylacetoacetate isomerase-like protein [Glomus cerebriforme]